MNGLILTFVGTFPPQVPHQSCNLQTDIHTTSQGKAHFLLWKGIKWNILNNIFWYLNFLDLNSSWWSCLFLFHIRYLLVFVTTWLCVHSVIWYITVLSWPRSRVCLQFFGKIRSLSLSVFHFHLTITLITVCSYYSSFDLQFNSICFNTLITNSYTRGVIMVVHRKIIIKQLPFILIGVWNPCIFLNCSCF